MSFILVRWPNFLMAHNQQNHEYSYQRTLQYSIIIVSDSVQIRSPGFYFLFYLFIQYFSFHLLISQGIEFKRLEAFVLILQVF